MIETFKKDVNEGLSKPQKTLPSKYFYDAVGDKIFVKIMNMPEYYLTDAEFEIFNIQSAGIIADLNLGKKNHFDLIELGAGDGTKTKLLLKELIKQEYNFEYLPIDISKDALHNLKCALSDEISNLKVTTKQGDYFNVLTDLKESKTPKIVLFLGSNLGNMIDEKAQDFMTKLGSSLNTNDKVILGLDLIKSEKIVLPAYSDKAGITKSFNLNLLSRINHELDADFDISNFNHLATYTEKEGIAKSFLVSEKNQQVTIKSINKTFSFDKDERIHTEVSRKYNDDILNKILQESDLQIYKKFTDTNHYFADYILTKK